MADAQPLAIDLSAEEMRGTPLYRRLGLINGLLIGVALGLGAWGLELLKILRLPVQLVLPALIAGFVAVVLLGGFVGWVTSRVGNTLITAILWTILGAAVVLIMGYLPYNGRTLVSWLADRRFWGRPVFPFALEGGNAGLILGGLLIMLALFVLGLLQAYRLENMVVEARNKRLLGWRTWFSLLLPLPLIFAVSLLTQRMMANPASTAAELTYQAIERVRAYDGDLYQLGLREGISYAALEPVRERLQGDYRLGVTDVNPLNSTVIVAGYFENGAWVYCRVINGQLSFCYDASPPYTIGFKSLITGEPLPDPCRGCGLRVSDEWTGWLANRREQLGPEPEIERLAQQGSQTLMRATNPANGFAVECWIVGVAPTALTSCDENNS